MGLFSSKYVTTVGTSASRVIEDKLLPNAIKTGTFNAILGEPSQDDTISGFIMEELIGSIGVKAERLYEWAGRSYAYGLPSGEFKDTQDIRDAIQVHLTTTLGGTITIDYAQLGPANELHMAWEKLIAEHGYNPATNQLGNLTAVKGQPVYLDDMFVVVAGSNLNARAPGSLAHWGLPPSAGYTPDRPLGATVGVYRPFTAPATDTSVSTDYVRVRYVWGQSVGPTYTGDGQIITEAVPAPKEVFDISMAGLVEGDYLHARYQRDGVPAYWSYRLGSGTYPALDALVESAHSEAGAFFPMCYVRFGFQSPLDDTTSDWYKQSVKFCRYLGMDFDAVADAINENPDIGQVKTAMLQLAVPAVSTDPLECRYLFQFFDNLYASAGTPIQWTPEKTLLDSALFYPPPSANAIVIQDARFKMALSNDGLYKRLVAGSIGPVGTHTAELSTHPATYTYRDVNPENSAEVLVGVVETHLHLYRHQVSANLYEEIQVVNLRMQHFIDGDYTSLLDGDDKQVLLIPIDRSIAGDYTMAEREQLYARSLHFLFHSAVVTKLKWYQQDWFITFLEIVAMAITVYTLGQDLGAGLAAVAALDAALVQLVIIIVKRIVLNFIISWAVKLFVKLVGIDVALIIAVILAAYGAAKGFDAGNFAVPEAQQMLKAASTLVSAAASYARDLMGDLVQDANDWQAWVKEQTKLLEDAKDLLDGRSHLLQPMVIWGEKPDDFYNRTVHAGNIGALGYSAISSYVDTALRLPTLDDSVGGELNGQ